MKILFLSPQPFFQERGTPIAVRLALEVLAGRGSDSIDLLVYHEGSTIEIPQVTIYRTPAISWLNHIRPGISVKKLLCDVLFLFSAFRLIWKNRAEQYQLIHAVEESVFMALIFKLIFRIPYIYDMDSSLSMQLTEKWGLLKPLAPLLSMLERMAIKNSRAVVPVCDTLAVLANKHGAPDLQILRDISLLNNQPETGGEPLRSQLKLSVDQELVLYIGNLEPYQGIDLLIESFHYVTERQNSAHLIIIGGNPAHIQHYQQKAAALGIASRVHLPGPRPVTDLRNLLLQADILVSPRTKGENTPMKIYSYLHAGKPIVATNLPTNTQVLDSSTSCLCEPRAVSFGSGILELLNDADKRKKLGENAYRTAEENYTFQVFERSLNQLYDRLSPGSSSSLKSSHG